MDFDTPISKLTKVGKTTAQRLKRLGLEKAADLLYYFPFRYEDFRQIKPISDLAEGEPVTIQGVIELIANRRSFKTRKIITEAVVNDQTGSFRVVWFNQPFIIKNLHPGDVVSLSGTVKQDMLGLELISPAYEKIIKGETIHTARLVPAYSLTEGLTQKQLRFLVKQIIQLAKNIPDWLPESVLENHDLVPLSQALEGIHFPVDEKDLAQSVRRLKFNELLILQLQAEIGRQDRVKNSAPKLAFQETAIQDFVKKLPFSLTKTQKISAWEILQDIAERKPMNRLLSGDVGSGKTVVAAIALYNTVLNGYQGVLLAPTEILAKQHYQSISKLLGSTLQIGLLTGAQFQISPDSSSLESRISRSPQIADPRLRSGLDFAPQQNRDKLLNQSKIPNKTDVVKAIADGSVNIIIGTHALLSENVSFNSLGLVVVDEQHRFGVMQRKVMKEKGKGVHFLSMTATPIPRSLALMLYGDLEVSIINELPPGRKKIITRLVEPVKRDKAYEFIRVQIKEGRQVFVVCPLIENQEPGIINGGDDKKSVLSEYEKLSKHVFPDLSVACLHGKMKAKEKEAIMEKFKDGTINILVSTSVIEVGVDIPNASVMMIEGSDRFGLAQLHQFRGRVGRSGHQSYCLLFTDSQSPKSLERLKYFEEHQDGFALAEKDLEIRGPGELYGTEQSGMMSLKLAKLSDRELLKEARETARELVTKLNDLPLLKKMLQDVEQWIHLE